MYSIHQGVFAANLPSNMNLALGRLQRERERERQTDKQTVRQSDNKKTIVSYRARTSERNVNRRKFGTL